MNHHPMPPYGHQPPVYPPRRQQQQDIPYHAMQSNLRAYPGYYPPHMGAPMPQYPPQPYPTQWYPYQQYPPHMPPHPRPYQQPPHHPQHPYQPLVVSSYPAGQPQQAPAHIHPQALPPQPNERPSTIPPQTLGAPLSPPPPSTPSSINNVQDTPPASSTGSIASETQPPVPPIVAPALSVEPDLAVKAPFEPPLPWLSVPDKVFPPRARGRRRRAVTPQPDSEPVQFLFREQTDETEDAGIPEGEVTDSATVVAHDANLPLQSDGGTPQTSVAPSENDSTQPTTPSSAVPHPTDARIPTQSKSSRSFAPALPVVPALPTSPVTPRRQHRDSILSTASKASSVAQSQMPDAEATASIASPTSDQTSKPPSPPKPPKSWADLVRSKATATAQPPVNGTAITPNVTGSLKSESLADMLIALSSDAAVYPSKLSFLEPKGLVNTGNMCYMNSILQTLIFCVPFYDFLDRLSREAIHSFKSDTPLLDAMILFMKEYVVIDSASSADQLRLRLKQEELEQYGDSFIPENVYEVIRTLPRFRDMRRGHQQDAQEFLGFLLEELHEECAMAMNSAGLLPAAAVPSEDGASYKSDDDGWMEVGHKQKASTTRSSGIVSLESPITKIFAGKLRSELRIPGVRQSNTVEPFESLQLDIGSPQINNITDALKGLSKPEAMQGEFNSPRGKVTATKQIFIEKLPPVLILHLKRFQYDNTTKRTEKIWKKVGYPLELEIPKEAFPPQTRNKLLNHGGFPKYRLIGAIYHHGKYANGGHYTVDVRRQDGLEWIRLDDTVIRRIRSRDVAEGGSEEDPKVLAAALEHHKRQSKLPVDGNIYDQIYGDDNESVNDTDKGWNQVNGSAGAHARSKSTVSGANGMSTPATAKESSGRQTPSQKYASGGVKDNKVAYLLFYQRIDRPA